MVKASKSKVRAEHRRKPSHKGKQCQRGKGLIYDEIKERLNLTITPTGKAKLEAKAKAERCSISTLIEEFARSVALEEFQVSADIQPSTSLEKT
ncbi:hypothetical protein [Coleofasciculus sp. FACHB-SPT9]|uniref:hypothetical protein n=1 Tax=Cyanophyceae TaxID=3028117 RepID=UPI001689F008|nr:hypothetical protein [Coleofasciculus sp. FACHB-SPT9]MBD1892924.1 hypothetical protein [Coleofasciculus sp. FACHB-SPT9]